MIETLILVQEITDRDAEHARDPDHEPEIVNRALTRLHFTDPTRAARNRFAEGLPIQIGPRLDERDEAFAQAAPNGILPALALACFQSANFSCHVVKYSKCPVGEI